jgi:4a-hydroxytetrahydrobiopterin dehydratase
VGNGTARLFAVAALSDEDISRTLEDLPGWRYGRGEIFKQYEFPTFLDAIAFIDRIAEVAEEANHHPDLENHYNRVRVALHTWSENAVTDKDVRLAHEIEALSNVGF